MALWSGLGQAATVAQLAGVDAGGLISMIIQAVQTVHRNREECQLLARHVMMIGDLLRLLQQTETMQRPEIKTPLNGLEDTLRQAYMLVTSCQQSNVIYRFFMAGNQAQKFRDVRDMIDSYLRMYPLISHIDTRRFITELYSRTHPSDTQPQASEEAESLASHANPDFRIEGSAADDSGIEPGAGAVTEPSAMEDHQPIGYENTEVLPNRRHQFRRLLQWARRDTSTPEYISGLLGRENGVLPNGTDVAIKINSVDTDQGIQEFRIELEIIPRLQHANIVKLLGCCIEGNHKILVYEYAERGSLHHIIHELQAGVFLAWPLRFRIIEGIAQGTVYLHQHSRIRSVHGDLKTSNILLDCDMTPMIGDFGDAEVLNSDEDDKEALVKGTVGYLDPEFFYSGIISTKSDVFAFGVTCLSVISAQHAVVLNGSEPKSLYSHSWELWSKGSAMELIDPSLRDDPGISEILRCLQVAMLCVQEKRADRPTMADVVMMLKCESMTLPVPKIWVAPADTSIEGAGESSSADGSETPGNASYIGAELTTDDDDDESFSYLSCCSDDGVDNGHASS
ncbi:hypothetical protein BS78_05G234100 [Paspalum vaginatum]|nr:hypothetical protein BS78_05G234100 [Paspalum vaginatum]